MERTIRDIMTRVEDLLSRVERQGTELTRAELNAIQIALKGLLSIYQARIARRSPFGAHR